MAIFDRFDLKVIAVGGLCGVAIALSPGIAAAGGYECLQTSAGEAGPAAAAPICAPVTEMAGVPMALPGPPLVPPPLVPPLVPPPLVPPLVPPPLVPPLVPPVPIVPIGAPIAGAPLAPLTTMGGAAGGKGDSTGPAPAGAPVAGQPIAPGPSGH
jgi:hypothetical protein